MGTGTSCILLVLGFMGLLAGCLGQQGPEANCPPYVSEGGTLRCTCIYPHTYTGSPPQFSWPGHSTNDLLRKNSMQRTDNGTEFTCVMTLNGQTSTANYTLQVAYGPASVSISGPQQISTNGSTPVTLTCSAAEVNPTPTFTWKNITCDNGNQGNQCTFTPTSAHEGRVVTCTATNIRVQPGAKSESGSYTLRVNCK